MKVPREPIPEDRLPIILARAAELDRATVTWETIRTAALDAGISRAAVDQALEEYASGNFNRAPVPVVPEPARRERWWRRWLKTLAEPARVVPIAFGCGLLAGANDFGPVLAWLAWVGFATYRVLRDRPGRKATSFTVAMVSIGFGLLFGMAAIEGDEDALAVLFFTGLTILATGPAIIKLRLPRWLVAKPQEQL
jgi:hypothetical protein